MNLGLAAKTSMLAGLSAAVEGGFLRLYEGPIPVAGGATTLLIASGVVAGMPPPSDGVLMLPPGFAALRFNGATVAWARLFAATGDRLMDLSVGVTGSGTDIELETLVGYTGGIIKLTSSSITIA